MKVPIELAPFKELYTLPIWFKSKALDQTSNICLNGCINKGSWLQTVETSLAILIVLKGFLGVILKADKITKRIEARVRK